MKKFLFLFVIMAFIAVMATGAMAEDPKCPVGPGGCLDCTPEDTLDVIYSVLGVNCLEIQDEAVCVSTYIPCEGTCCGAWVDFDYTVTVTGNSQRKIVGKVQDEAAGAPAFWVDFGTPTELGDTEVDVATLNEAGCGENLTARLQICADPNTSETCNANATLWFKIMDSGTSCVPCGA